jgi:hypothetical protein
VPFSVLSVDGAFAEAIRWHLEPFRRHRAEHLSVPVRMYVREEDAGRDPPLYSLFRDRVLVRQSARPAALLSYAVWDIHDYGANKTRDFLLLHSGAVADGEGALLLPASTGGGKSTLTASLLGQGFRYLSDDRAPVDPVTSRLYPFPKRISLKRGSMTYFPGLEERLADRTVLPASQDERFVRPKDLGATVADPAPVRWIVFPSPDRQGPPRLTRIARAETVEWLAAHTQNMHRYSERGVVLLSRVARDAEAFRLEGGSPPQRAELLREQLTA